jgi:hypothetical protein
MGLRSFGYLRGRRPGALRQPGSCVVFPAESGVLETDEPQAWSIHRGGQSVARRLTRLRTTQSTTRGVANSSSPQRGTTPVTATPMNSRSQPNSMIFKMTHSRA